MEEEREGREGRGGGGNGGNGGTRRMINWLLQQKRSGGGGKHKAAGWGEWPKAANRRRHEKEANKHTNT
jgi:hypothetical protein